MVTFVTRAGHRNCLVKTSDMTIYWKALEDNFVVVPLVFDSTIFWGKYIFLIFLKKPRTNVVA
jgi:hypothetical protein